MFTVSQRDPHAEQNAYAQAAHAALAYSPSVYQHANATLLIDVTYSLRLFGGIRLIVQGLRQQPQTLSRKFKAALRLLLPRVAVTRCAALTVT